MIRRWDLDPTGGTRVTPMVGRRPPAGEAVGLYGFPVRYVVVWLLLAAWNLWSLASHPGSLFKWPALVSWIFLIFSLVETYQTMFTPLIEISATAIKRAYHRHPIPWVDVTEVLPPMRAFVGPGLRLRKGRSITLARIGADRQDALENLVPR
jgi:hypothetical protein